MTSPDTARLRAIAEAAMKKREEWRTVPPDLGPNVAAFDVPTVLALLDEVEAGRALRAALFHPDHDSRDYDCCLACGDPGHRKGCPVAAYDAKVKS